MINPKSLNNLKPPVKGEVRNPKGKPKGIPNAKTRYRRLLELTSKKANPVTGEMEEFTQLELMDMAIFNKALKGDMAAYKEIMDRLEGKSQQSVDHTTKGEKILPILGGISVQTHDSNEEINTTIQEN